MVAAVMSGRGILIVTEKKNYSKVTKANPIAGVSEREYSKKRRLNVAYKRFNAEDIVIKGWKSG